MSSGATTSAGRAKKDWVRFWEGVVAMGVAVSECTDTIHLAIPQLTSQVKNCSTLQQKIVLVDF